MAKKTKKATTKTKTTKAKGAAKRKGQTKRSTGARTRPTQILVTEEYRGIARELAVVRGQLKGGSATGDQVRQSTAIRNIEIVRALLRLPDVDVTAAPADGHPSYRRVHQEIRGAREPLFRRYDGLPDGVEKEQLEAAIRDLDIARVVLECNQSQSATNYNLEPWNEIVAPGTMS
jgi:hypothetical protein